MSCVPITMPTEAKLITALGQCAVEHDKRCEDTKEHEEDCPHATCFENRTHLVAALMLELGMGICDVGFVADAILELEYMSDEEVPAGQSEDVLDAKELDG